MRGREYNLRVDLEVDFFHFECMFCIIVGAKSKLYKPAKRKYRQNSKHKDRTKKKRGAESKAERR